MLKEDAQNTVIRDWLARPQQGRTQVDALIFVNHARERYRFQCKGDAHQNIMGWIRPHIVD